MATHHRAGATFSALPHKRPGSAAWWKTGLAGLGTVALVTLGTIAGTTSAHAEPAPNATAFTSGPGAYSATAPGGVCSVQIVALGGAGGSSIAANATNGAGARITATYPVTPGTVISGIVGSGGRPGANAANSEGPGGTPGGGNGGKAAGYSNVYHTGAGGGGYTSVWFGEDNPVIIAAGGGGSGGGHTPAGKTYGFGGNGGLPTASGFTAGQNGYDGYDGNIGQNNGGRIGGGIPGGGMGGQADAQGLGGTHTTNPTLNGFDGLETEGGNGGDDPGADSGAAGGGGATGGGGGASTWLSNSDGGAQGVSGAGGGGGSSYVAESAPTGSVSGLSSVAGPKVNAATTGANGSVTLNWIMCNYDLTIAKQVTGPDANGLTTWTLTAKNVGPENMAIGDTVTFSDQLPGTPTTVTSITAPEGVSSSDIAVGAPMLQTVEFKRADGSGLQVGESVTVVYTQTLTAAGTYQNTVGVQDRSVLNNNYSTATTEVVGPTTNEGSSMGAKGKTQHWVPTPTAGTFPINCEETLQLIDPADATPTDTVAVPGEGTYTVSGCAIQFVPASDFTGTVATQVSYRVQDSHGNTAENVYTPTVTVPPTAVSDETEGPWNYMQYSAVLENDLPGDPDYPLDPSTLKLVGADADGKVVVDGEGTYEINRTTPTDPIVKFTPDQDYYGRPTPVAYTVEDTNGAEAGATYQPFLYAPPIAAPVTSTGLQGQVQNQTPDVTKRNVNLVSGFLQIFDSSRGWVTIPVTVDGQGTYSVEDGTLVFTPDRSFTGTATPIAYQVKDERDEWAGSTYTPTVTAVTPRATNDSSVGRPNHAQSVDPLENDAPGDPSVPLDPSTLKLEGADADGKVVVVEGIYTIDEGRIVFTPNQNYFGTPTPARYTVDDENGTQTGASYQPEVTTAVPATNSGATTGPQGLSQSWAPTPLAGEDFAIDWSTLTLLSDQGNPVAKVTIDGEGTYTIDNHTIVFTPEPTFIGEAAPASYRISDAGGQHAEATYTPSTIAVTPTAVNDASSGWWNTPQSVDPLVNDEPGDASVPLDPPSLTLLDSNGKPSDKVAVAEGLYTLDEGRIVFTPKHGYVGSPTPVSYRVADTNGTASEAGYQPAVNGAPFKKNLSQDLTCGAPATFAMADKVAGLDPTTVMLLDTGGKPVTELTVKGQGTWKVDTKTGQVTFTPGGCITGKLTPVRWEGWLSDGTPAAGELAIAYGATPNAPAPLPATGSNATILFGAAGLGALLIAAGSGLLIARRRRANG